MSNKKLLKEDGMGLLEVLVSMIILAIGILGMAPMIVTAVDGNVVSRDNTTASNLITQKLEFYEDQDTLPTVPFVEKEEGLGDGFARVTRIKDSTVDTLIPSGVYEVEVAVIWSDHKNISHARTYSTYIPKG